MDVINFATAMCSLPEQLQDLVAHGGEASSDDSTKTSPVVEVIARRSILTLASNWRAEALVFGFSEAIQLNVEFNTEFGLSFARVSYLVTLVVVAGFVGRSRAPARDSYTMVARRTYEPF